MPAGGETSVEAMLRETGTASPRWHFVGQLQRNKARYVARLFHCVESVDRIELAHLLENLTVDSSHVFQRMTGTARAKGTLKPLKLVVNAGNGGAGLVIDRLEEKLPFEFVKVQHQPDGTFPHGVPNPLLPEHRAATADAVVEVMVPHDRRVSPTCSRGIRS